MTGTKVPSTSWNTRSAASESAECLGFVRLVLPGIAQAGTQPSIVVGECPNQTFASGDVRGLAGEHGIGERLLRADDTIALTLQRIEQVAQEKRVEAGCDVAAVYARSNGR